MNLFRLYLYTPDRHSRKIVIPTVMETDDGVFVDRAPIRIFDPTDELSWRNYSFEAMSHANKLIETPERSESPGSEILEQLGIKKWSTFEKASIMYTIHRTCGYIFSYATGKSADGMWSHIKESTRRFHPATPLDWVLEALAQSVREQEAQSPKTTLMLSSQ